MNDPAIRVGTLTPAEVAEWAAFEAQQRPGVDLINCRECVGRSGARCQPLSMPHVPLHLSHRCAHFKASRRRSQ